MNPNRFRRRDSDQTIEQLAWVRAVAEDGMARANYALEVARDMSLPSRMLALMSWLELQAPPEAPPISVIMPTRDRPALLPRAIESVLGQRFQAWELIVVDNGETDSVPRTLDAFDDDRVRAVEGPRSGPGAARNAGLAAASGEIVCYLDDDNVMHPAWLHAVAHVFSQRNDYDVIYGVSIAEHRLPDELGPHGWWPSFWQLPWSRETLLEENVSDIGAIAHRREMEEARFAEDIVSGDDWDLLLRLTADREALAVPAISHAYSMAGNDRMSLKPEHRTGLEQVRRRHSGS